MAAPSFRILGAVLVLLGLDNGPSEAQSLRVQVIDVGQADAILTRTPRHQWVLIDAGQGSLIGDSLPTQFRVDRLRLAVGSHRHRDHIGGMAHLLRRVPTDLFIGDTLEYLGGTDDDRVREVLRTRSIPVRLPQADTLMVDSVRFIILPPPPLHPNENNNSVVVRIEYGEFSMLFVGDAEQAQRDWLVDNHRDLLNADVLKASHHGSHNGTSPRWLNAVSPSAVVISAGLHRGFKHPHAEAVQAYEAVARVWCTNRHGTVRIYGYSDGRTRVSRQRPSTKSCTYDGTIY